MTQTHLDSWRIASIPFVWSALQQPTNGYGLPDSLPFELGFDAKTGLVVQKYSEQVQSALATAYVKGSSLSGFMDEDGIGRQYAEDFLSFIFRAVSTLNLSRLKVLEIGCGNGYLLKRLRDCGAEVLGVEPGGHGQEGKIKWGVPIFRGMFPTPEIQGQFDLVISFAVLEHVQDPQAFLSFIKPNLAPNGLVICAVPDVGPYIDTGDISALFHEHWSYFDELTLLSTVQLAGYHMTRSEKSGYGGALYCAMRSTAEIESPAPEVVSISIRRARDYLAGTQENCEKFASYLSSALDKNETLGIYVPCRALNALKLTGYPTLNIRFFDDNVLLWGTFYPGINVPVENRQALLNDPTDHVLIMSRTFGVNIAQDLKRELPKNIVVTTIAEILER